MSYIRRIFHAGAQQFFLLACLIAPLLSGCGKVSYSEEEWESSVAKCWPCALYKTTFDAIEIAMDNVIETTCGMAHVLLGVGLLFYLGFHVLKMMSPFKPPNVREFLFNMMIVLFKAIAVSALLMNWEEYLAFLGEYIVQPVLGAFLELSSSLLMSSDVVKQRLIAPETIAGSGSAIAADGVLFGDIPLRVQEIIYRIYVAMKIGVGLGANIAAQISLPSFLIGVYVMYIFFVLLLVFPVMFVDSFLRLGITLVLSPFLFVTWVFPATPGYLKKGWEVLFGSMFNILFACIFIGILVYVVTVFAEQTYPGIFGSALQKSSPAFAEDVRRLSTSSLGFLVLVMALNKLSRHIPQLAGFFGGDGSQSGIIQAANGFKQLAINAAKIAAGVVMGNPQLIADGANGLKKQAEEGLRSLGGEGG